MATQQLPAALANCPPCSTTAVQPSLFQRYRGFLLSFNTLVTIANAALLLAGAVASLVFQAQTAANVLWIASALIGGLPIFILAVRGIMKGDLTAGVMVSVAMIGAILIGEYSAAALVAFMMMFGEMLENLTMARADDALKELAQLIPAEVTLVREGQPVVVPVEQLRPGDILLVRNGERIAADAVVVSGQAAVDESTITGESLPVDKQAGDQVFAGTINTGGVLQVRAQKVGRDTTLGTIVKLVENAQKSQAPVERLANKYAQYLVPITFGLAILVFLLTGDPVRSVTVLVVVCPCALVLATPTAIVAAIGNAARSNAVVKSGAGIEALGRVDVVAFDKTGTLTVGRPQVEDVVALDSYSADAILGFAAMAERLSEHPLGRAIVGAVEQRQISIPDATQSEVLTGFGVRAVSEGRSVIVGNRQLLQTSGVAFTERDSAQFLSLEQSGRTVVPVVVNRLPVGLITLTDAVRPDAATIVRDLKAAGIKRIVLISGDNSAAVTSVASQLGIDEFHAQVLPQQKLDIIKQLQAQGHRVAYVGDGVNDSPALAVADVGIAMGAAGTDIAIQTAGIALMTDDIKNLPHLIALARETLRTVRVNVAFSMSMNVIALSLSMFGIIGPAFGALMHELSAIPVIGYSARLVSYQRHDKQTLPAGDLPPGD